MGQDTVVNDDDSNSDDDVESYEETVSFIDSEIIFNPGANNDKLMLRSDDVDVNIHTIDSEFPSCRFNETAARNGKYRTNKLAGGSGSRIS